MKSWRLSFVLFFFSLFAGLIFWRLFSLQISQADFYKAMSQGLNSGKDGTTQSRGEIFLKNGEPLAINKNFPLVFASPAKIDDLERTAKTLSFILSLPEDFVGSKITGDSLYSLIKSEISAEEEKAVAETDLPGIYLSQEKKPYFPQETMASQVIGFVDADSKGRYGLQEYYEKNLIEEGEDLNLTIDYNIQFMAEKLLGQFNDKLGIRAGEIIVMEPDSGRILALANFPNFNPNGYKEYAQKGNLDIFLNSATQKIFEPGSIFKPITMAAALEEQKITPQTLYTDEGVVKVGGYKILNYDNRVYDLQTMTNVLEKSINTGAVFAGRRLGSNLFLKYIEKFGFFEKSGIDLAEVYSDNREFKKGYEINFTTASFGQGIEMTPVQLVRAFSAIANNGKMAKPYLVENMNKPEFSQPVISSKTASQLTAMLASVVENGFGKGAKIKGYNIAGKTGTAQIPFAALGINKAGYSEETTQSFIGFFPAFNPKFLMLVKLDNPGTKTAEYSAVPIFHDLAEYIIRLYQIPPDYE